MATVARGSFDLLVEGLINPNFPRNRRPRLSAVSKEAFDTPTTYRTNSFSGSESTDAESDLSESSPCQLSSPCSPYQAIFRNEEPKADDVVSECESMDYDFLGESSDEEFGTKIGHADATIDHELDASFCDVPSYPADEVEEQPMAEDCWEILITSKCSQRQRRLRAMLRERCYVDDVPAVGGAPRAQRRRISATRRSSCESLQAFLSASDSIAAATVAVDSAAAESVAVSSAAVVDSVDVELCGANSSAVDGVAVDSTPSDVPAVGGAPRPPRRRLSRWGTTSQGMGSESSRRLSGQDMSLQASASAVSNHVDA